MTGNLPAIPVDPLEPPLSGWARFWTSVFGSKKRTIRQELIWFLGDDYRNLETHEKSFPGYDLASLHRAISSISQECCIGYRELGGSNATNVRELFDLLEQPWYRNALPMQTPFQRVAVDVEEEISLPVNLLALAVLRPEIGRHHRRRSASLGSKPATLLPPLEQPERVLVMLSSANQNGDYWDNIDGRGAAPQTVLKVSIACKNREIANRFFNEVEERRRRLSVYRGKVIDPVVGGGSIHSIGFRPIEQVNEEDLILSDEVKQLIQSSILQFYQHSHRLESLGIEMKRGVLFHSPPGTGKTSISLYLAGLLPKFTICFVSGERLLYPREICRMARYLQPSMVVFEDIDLVAEERNATGLATVLGELMNQIDGCEVTDQVLFVMNTNSLERLEKAVRNRPGRVDQIIAIPIPDAATRERLIRHFARTLELAVEDMPKLVRATDGATPAMLKEIVKRAAVNALSELVERQATESETEIGTSDDLKSESESESESESGGDPEFGGESESGSGEMLPPMPPLRLTDADLLLATEQVRAMRDPEPSPGRFGFGDPIR
ncbi:AAA family ATPase [Tuwongella immobilis]|uniref:AAA+ ATPase domain-containing protein n=1 Tax=Tuwongella immobilis TaxID=692036 RepID=A0A6C2YKK9_9BACT|nr:ATP-binding protein [Tuwongella immobilis]VIP01966.1 cell division protein : Cell division protein FtsH OS=Fimbriimonas ginsengisoli Gsoil 348 GN=OP10G_2113 PE=4 SV=1: AAA [Tuwongella immobilis]VTR99984.1 cell division protein : Cell division protein FtsH OS=Fimbriimonas ginsengisoli Gsoil 348 GN=OP10G_2113 PE=4 SV=1: AAA [Tuwongella immobilis]